MKYRRMIPVMFVFVIAVFLAFSTGPSSGQGQVRVETVIGNLDIPWAAQFAPDGRLFLTERPGRIRIIRQGRIDPQPWATLEVAHEGEGGLLGLALDPDFARTRGVYIYHTYRENGRLLNRVVQLTDRSGRGQIDKVIIDRIPGAPVHDGGRIKFGPDRKLYVTTGDARQSSLAQDRASLAGKILRLNPDGSVPDDNPFAGSPVYSLGHRNPQGLAWHPQTRRLFAAEHGPSGERGLCCRDEVNIIEAGKNYGWPEISGRGGGSGFVDPIADSGRDDTWAPSGILIPSRGPWQGSVLVTALRGMHLRRFILAGPEFVRVADQEVYFSGDLGRLRDVFQGPDGTIYLLTNNSDGRGRRGANDDRLLRIVFP